MREAPGGWPWRQAAANRRPLDAGTTEAQYRVHVLCQTDAMPDMRDPTTAPLESVTR